MKKALILAGAAVMLLALVSNASAQTSKNDGVMLFKQYCATCHGLDGKGAGPSAQALKKAPTDLTTLQAKGQKFPGERVVHSIDGTGETGGAHGNRDMPIWGQAFRYTKGTPPAELSITRVVSYIESIQVNK